MLKGVERKFRALLVARCSERAVRSRVVMEHGAEVFAINALAANRAAEEPFVVPLGFALGHRRFDAVVQIGRKSVIRHAA